MNKIPESYPMTSMSPLFIDICINVKPFTDMNSKALDIKTFQLLVPSAAHYLVFTKFYIG